MNDSFNYKQQREFRGSQRLTLGEIPLMLKLNLIGEDEEENKKSNKKVLIFYLPFPMPSWASFYTNLETNDRTLHRTCFVFPLRLFPFVAFVRVCNRHTCSGEAPPPTLLLQLIGPNVGPGSPWVEIRSAL